MQSPTVTVNSPDVDYTEEHIVSSYSYLTTKAERDEAGNVKVEPVKAAYKFRTDRQVPKTGVMLVGWGGNNGSTMTAAVIANRERISWRTRAGVQYPDYFGSITQSATIRMGYDSENQEISVPLGTVVPTLSPDDFVIGGWDISGKDLASAMDRAQVLDYDLQRQLQPWMADMKPLPSIYYPDYIAANQEDRADNLMAGDDKQAHLEQVRKDIRDFKQANGLDKVIVLWTANTERFSEVRDGLNDTAENLLKSIAASDSEVSPSTIFAVASILEGSAFINGSPANTLVPGAVELATKEGVFVGGDDFKSGQTKFKSCMVEWLVGAGIKPTCIASYNHLGNNDGKNLNSPAQFRSKEISKTNVVDDMVAGNTILYPDGEGPDHCIVIKYLPAVGDSKRAMDEYTSKIFMGGTHTMVIHNTCEDSLLAAPLMIDLVVLTELAQRIRFAATEGGQWESFHPVLSLLSYMLKAPTVPEGTPIVNALFRQKCCIENIFRALVGLPAENNMLLEFKRAKQEQASAPAAAAGSAAVSA